ncbi:Amino acid transporter transmembrane [Penicillium argentinense]|uniref:Amino acid transporter transmembrane n=1 Tax=Penicillium argentinense TaxID=1131581 RepID=A0A9W9EJP4_9EURO|nr:Amino acid transporter transmembrane [Penicillium argentinense]KAJ5083088.1 Amino acid transporter transmembrane [Penicillium argentinense]
MGYEDNSDNGYGPKGLSDSEGEKAYVAPPPFEADMVGEMSEAERHIYDHGIQKYNRLGWKRLTIVLIVEAIALGSLSIPQTFAYLGMVAGTICCVGLGLVAIYTSYIVGQVKLAFPQVANYADAGRLMWGRFGYELINMMLVLQLIFLTGSHCLTGTIAFMNITGSDICSVIFAVVSAIILLALAVPPSFTEVAILGYVDFASIIIAIGITIIGTGVDAQSQPGGLAAVPWSAWPKADLTFTEAFIAVSNIIFAYSFAMCQFSFMDEMHTPKDFVKSIWALGITEIVVYTITGALIYAFVGQDVSSPALTSAGATLSRVAYGVALPVIFISGSINTVVLGRLVHGRIFANSPIRFINTKMGWITWLAVITGATIIAFVIAEVIPFFNDLLSISSALFISGFTFYFPALMWFMLIRKGGIMEPKNLLLTVINGFILIIGLVILVAGTYSSIDDIIDKYRTGSVRGVFTCAAPS